MKRDLYETFFKDKKVTVLGLGLLGRGVGDTKFLIDNESDVICTDTRSAEKLAESVAFITKDNPPNLQLVIGENRFEDFENRDFVLTCAGMPIGYPYLEHAKKKNIPVYMSAALVVSIAKKHFPNLTAIGITGTRGKSTTTELIAHILREAGRRVHLGGNIRGMANLPLLEALEDGDYLVLELDSWQLQGFGDMKLSPDIAVFTSFLDDHLNYYKGDREAYFRDKAQLFINQKTSCLIASSQAYDEIRKRMDVDMTVPKVKQYDAQIIGTHNNVSISLAVEAVVKCGILPQEAEEYARTFKPVEGRLQNLGIVKDVTVYNDNNATTADATVAGINAVCEKHGKKPILIMGGSDKNLPLEKLEDTVREKVKTYILLAGTGTDKLTLSKDTMHEKLEDCVLAAFAVAVPGDVILFSPGFASFSDYFKNEYERNDAFMRQIKNM